MLGSFWGLSAPVLGQKSDSSEGKKEASNGAFFPSLKRHFLRGEKVSILNGLEPALGLGLLGVGPLGLN